MDQIIEKSLLVSYCKTCLINKGIAASFFKSSGASSLILALGLVSWRSFWPLNNTYKIAVKRYVGKAELLNYKRRTQKLFVDFLISLWLLPILKKVQAENRGIPLCL